MHEELVIICILRHVALDKANISAFLTVLGGPEYGFCYLHGQISEENGGTGAVGRTLLPRQMPVAPSARALQWQVDQGLMDTNLPVSTTT
jgi:hypothetical protein